MSGPKSVNLLGDPRSKKHTSYVRLDHFNLNPFTIVGYREKSDSPHKSIYFEGYTTVPTLTFRAWASCVITWLQLLNFILLG